MHVTFAELNIVVLGRQNPGILSHRFLVGEGILTPETPDPQPFLTPVFSQLSYEGFSIQVDQNRLLIQQKYSPGELIHVNGLVTRYYNCLKYTPLTAYGLNLVGEVNWNSAEVYARFRDTNCASKERISKNLNSNEWSLGLSIAFKNGNHAYKISIEPPLDEPRSSTNLNCHRDLTGIDALGTLVKELGDISDHIAKANLAYSAILGAEKS